MASQIQLTRSGTPGAQPTAAEMELGELALNYADGKLYFKNDTNNIELLNSMSNMSGQKIIVNETDNHIGLNTTSPNFLLDLGGAVSNLDNTLRINQTTGGTAIRIGSDGVPSDEDITLLRVDKLDGETNSAAEGFSIKYLGTNSNNELGIFTDNGSSELQTLTILQNGNIGIRNNTPIHELDVAGTIRVTNSTNFITFNDGAEDMGFILNNAGKLAINAGGTTDVLQLQTNGGTRVHIDNSGRVGIGTTSPDPGATVHVRKGAPRLLLDGYGAASEDSEISRISGLWDGTYVADIRFLAGDDTTNKDNGKIEFRTYTSDGSTDARMTINSTGNVGIGTTSPSEALEVVGNATAAEPTISTHLTTKNYVDSLISTVQHTGSAVTQISGCTISRTAAGLYTITLDVDSGQLPTAVAGLSIDFATGSYKNDADPQSLEGVIVTQEATSGGNHGNMKGEFSISAQTISNTRVDIEIVELASFRQSAGGDDSNTSAAFKRFNVDAPFQVLITNR